MNKKKHLPVRVDEGLLKRFHYVCAYNGRKASAQILLWIRRSVELYEEQHGKITEEDLNSVMVDNNDLPE